MNAGTTLLVLLALNVSLNEVSKWQHYSLFSGLPLYNQLPWRPGTHYEPNVCEACQCFNHADRCEYDEEIEQQKLSVTPEGKYEGGGRCIDCRVQFYSFYEYKL